MKYLKYRKPRAACAYRTKIARAGERRPVTIRDVTNAGACVELGPSELDEGDGIKLWIMERPLEAQVRWAEGKVIGVLFTRQLTPRELAVIRHQSHMNHVGGPARRSIHGFAEL